jgi:hypothetical protein
VTPDIRLKFASGLYSQNIISTKSDRDIVNFFTGFLLSPDQTIYKNPQTAPPSDPVETNLMTAYHILGGIEVDVRDVEFNLEPWYKKFTQNIELNRNKGGIRPDGTIDNADFAFEKGKAYGLDLSAKYSKRRVFLWGVVGYQYVDREFIKDITGAVTTYPPPFDRRFNMNLLGSYTFGVHKDLEVSGRYNMGSPFPFTQTQGFYEQLNLISSGVSTNYPQQNGQIGLLYAQEINGGRLSYYHRVDLSVKKRFAVNGSNNIETTLSITNVSNRSNIFYVNRIDNTRVFQLPIFPSVNVTWNF